MARLRAFGTDGRWQPTGEALGEGGQAHIHVVGDSTGQRDGEFVLKLLKNAKRTPRLDREISTTKRLYAAGCPVLEIVDDYLSSDPTADRPWYVAPRHRPGALSKRLKAGEHYGNSLEAALQLYKEIVAGVLSVHREKVAHRDLKPDNILLGDTRVVLADLGLVLALGEMEGERLTEELERIGSLHYTPPEAFSRRPAGEQQYANDAFALGKILYDLVAGSTLPAFVSPADPDYDLAKKWDGPSYRGINRVLRGLLHDDPTVRLTYLQELPGQIDEFLAVERSKDPPALSPTWHTDLLSASDLLASRPAVKTAPRPEEIMKDEAEQLSRETLDVWQKSDAIARLDKALGAARGGKLVVTQPTHNATARSMLGGLQPTKKGMEPLQDRGYPLFPAAEQGCELSVSSTNPEIVPFRQQWLCGTVAVKDQSITAAICIVRREEGARGATDVVGNHFRVISGRRNDVALVAKVRAAAEEMLAQYVQTVVAEVRRVATAKK